MTYTMADMLILNGAPVVLDVDFIATYIDDPRTGPGDNIAHARARWPGKTIVPISNHGHPVDAYGNKARVYDVETGAVTPAQLPGLFVASRGLGIDPCVYANDGSWSASVAACNAAGVAVDLHWLAHWGQPPIVPPGKAAIQYNGVPGYDLSVVSDSWGNTLMTAPSVDQNWSKSIPIDAVAFPGPFTDPTTGILYPAGSRPAWWALSQALAEATAANTGVIALTKIVQAMTPGTTLPTGEVTLTGTVKFDA